ncbi:hypothetical protein [Pararhodobacter sp.]|uniref:hypothetical protein n=1 Tax=Pararhodobacter sp. TaxID=2127056 RepID=UPI002FDDD8C6
MLIRRLMIAALIAYTVLEALAQRSRRLAQERASGTPEPDVRQAGRRAMKDPPRDWDMTDERADESFPASDPPGTY